MTKINAAGTTLVYSTFLGGDGTDVGYAIALNSSGDAYIAGNTTSANFPTLNPIQAAKADTDQGAFDAFVSRINAAGTALVYSTYLGGPFTPGLSQDIASGIAVAPSGDAYVIGTTGSQSFPTVNAFQDTTGGDDDAFVLRINAAGTALVFSSYLGGSSSENGSGIAVDSSGNAYVTGGTLSNNFPTVNPFQASKGGQFQFDAFVAKIGEGSAEVVATLGNIATRMRVLTEDRALIGGFIITGSDPKRVIIRGIGPSLAGFVADALANPTLELFDANSALLASNDDWKSNQAEVEATTIPPSNDLESAIVKTLAPAAYTAVLRGQNNATGIGVVEVYDLDNAANSTLANISSRGFVDSGDNVMIGGFIVGGGNAEARVLVRGIGPSLAGFVADALANPTLELRDGNGSLIRANDNWRESQEAEIQDTTIPPTNDLESAIVASVGNGNYTAILRGKDDTTGVAVVEVYNLQ